MKYLRVLFLFSLALFCGSATSHAQFDFHATVLDPSPVCPTPTQCFIFDTSPFAVQFTSAQCALLNLPSGPDDGCFFGINSTGGPITSLSLIFPNTTNLGAITCDNASNPPGLPPTVFTNPTCSNVGGVYTLLFTGGSLGQDQAFTIFEDGAPPSDLGVGVGQVNAPEPTSLLLFATGAAMIGLYMAKDRRLFAFLKR
jgi:hypothetical protein